MSDYVGIDIGAKSVVMCVRSDGRTAKAQEFSQTPESHQALIKKLGQQVVGVVLEATGIYYLDLAVALSRAGLPVSVINPRSFHHFASIKLSNSKTDAVDVVLLAEYAECMKPAPWQAPDEALMGLRDLGRQINRLTHARTQAKSRLHALKSKSSTLAMLIEDEDDGIKQLDRRIERLSKAASELMSQQPECRQHLEISPVPRGSARLAP